MAGVGIAVTLRHNVRLRGDIELAKRELRALLDSEPPVELSSCAFEEGVAALLGSAPWSTLTERLRTEDPVALAVQPVEDSKVAEVVRRVAFGQDLIVFGRDEDVTSSLAPLGPDTYRIFRGGGSAVGLAPTHSALAEYATAAIGVFSKPGQLRAGLDLLLLHLLGELADNRSNELLLKKVIRAKKTTLSLTHDLHIYKAKFFPRMVRALINIYGRESQTLLDPFSGSGTALLEASSLGLRSLGFDIDPLSALMSSAKVEPFTRHREETERYLRTLQEDLRASEEGWPITRGLNQLENDSSAVFPTELLAKLIRRDKKEGTTFAAEIADDFARLCALTPTIDEDPYGVARVLFSDAVTKKIRYRFVGVGNGRYTIEVVKQRMAERLREKIFSATLTCVVFEWLESRLGVVFAESKAAVGDARQLSKALPATRGLLCLTSPPYLPASSGREHYAESRRLAFQVTGLASPEVGVVGTSSVISATIDLQTLTRSSRDLLQYLLSDSERTDPQRDPMRFARKAVPTWCYLLDIERFLHELRKVSGPGSRCLLVVASQHTFYSHRRQEVEYVANGRELYGEIAERAGWVLDEEVRVELAKSATSHARPQAKEDYFESVLVLRLA